MRHIKHSYPLAFYTLIICLALGFFFTFQLILTDGASMEPTYNSGDLLLKVAKFQEPQVGDIVVIEHQGVLMVKRVAAVAGQKALAPHNPVLESNIPSENILQYQQLGTDDYLRVFDLWDNYLYWTQYNYWSQDGSCIVPEGKIFVVGDNLSKSYDSRYEDFGLISTDQVKGYIILRLWEGCGNE